jgi:hypothetical protein
MALMHNAFVTLYVKKEVHIPSTRSCACVRYMGNTTTNIVEYANSRLKKYLTSSMGCLCMNWPFVHNMLESHSDTCVVPHEHDHA